MATASKADPSSTVAIAVAPQTAAAGKDDASRPRRLRKRSVLACRKCNARKVRCNVTASGPPCTNCLEDGVECDVSACGRGRARHRLAKLLTEQKQSEVATLTTSMAPATTTQGHKSPAAALGEARPETKPEQTSPSSATTIDFAMDTIAETLAGTTPQTTPQTTATAASDTSNNNDPLSPPSAHGHLLHQVWKPQAAPGIIDDAILPPGHALSMCAADGDDLDSVSSPHDESMRRLVAFLEHNDETPDVSDDRAAAAGNDDGSGQTETTAAPAAAKRRRLDPAQEVVDEETSVIFTGDEQGMGFLLEVVSPGREGGGLRNHFVMPRGSDVVVAASAAAKCRSRAAKCKLEEAGRTACTSPSCSSALSSASSTILLATPASPSSTSGVPLNSLLPEDIAALKAKGCFALPADKHVRDSLVRAYFCHVHPYLPILHVARFLEEYDADWGKSTNLLLLWAMFFAAASYIDDDVLTQAGYTTRKAMKWDYYRRAKALYDADYERDKITIIQSVILMGFWYVDIEDRKGSWYWIGIAISLCQTMGLHRRPSWFDHEGEERPAYGHAATRGKWSSSRLARLWRLLWWTCYFRDTWLSFGVGRPPRIHLEDCDMPVPTSRDVEALTTDGVPPALAVRYLPADPHRVLPRLWSSLQDITFCLGRILRTHYATRPLETATVETLAPAVERHYRELVQCRSQFPAETPCHDGDKKVLLSLLYHLHIYYESMVIVLHRPYIASNPLSSAVDDAATLQEELRVCALQRAKIAASNINCIFHQVNVCKMLDKCQAIMITCITPALQVHLFTSVSSDPLAKALARHQLDSCMIILNQLRHTYWSADMIYSLFSKARAKLILSGRWHPHMQHQQESPKESKAGENSVDSRERPRPERPTKQQTAPKPDKGKEAVVPQKPDPPSIDSLLQTPQIEPVHFHLAAATTPTTTAAAASDLSMPSLSPHQASSRIHSPVDAYPPHHLFPGPADLFSSAMSVIAPSSDYAANMTTDCLAPDVRDSSTKLLPPGFHSDLVDIILPNELFDFDFSWQPPNGFTYSAKAPAEHEKQPALQEPDHGDLPKDDDLHFLLYSDDVEPFIM